MDRKKHPKLKRIVLIGHSQGCIIISNVLQLIANDTTSPLPAEDVAKIEVHLFASPASKLDYLAEKVRIEHYANENDLVAAIGVLSPNIRKVGLLKLSLHTQEERRKKLSEGNEAKDREWEVRKEKVEGESTVREKWTKKKEKKKKEKREE